eukprot:XP_019923337.1 PREDICTED: uncharacterized protein LOC109618916 [Crassostrea gigas]
MASLNTGRKKRDLVNCADCCADAPNENGPCNAALCGLKPQPLQATCVVCNGIHSDVRSCTQAATCPPNEACFTGIRIVGTAIRYVFGCYEERVCKAMLDNDNTNSTITRQGRIIHGDQGIRICDACEPQPLQATCVVCNGIHSDVRSCTQAATCPPNEACFTGIRIVGTAIRYVFGCYEERVCKAMLDNDNTNSTITRQGRIIHGDQGIRICDACCKGDRCNAADCFDLRKKMTAGDFSNGSTTPVPTGNP